MAKIYCVCKEASDDTCDHCGKAAKFGPDTKLVGNDTWPRVRHIHKPLIVSNHAKRHTD